MGCRPRFDGGNESVRRVGGEVGAEVNQRDEAKGTGGEKGSGA